MGRLIETLNAQLYRLGKNVRRALGPDPRAMLKSCRSIVHVGANTGQEREHYEKLGLDVLWVEPIPAVYDQLEVNIRAFPRQKAVRALVADTDGESRILNISSNNGASSSILDLAMHREIWPHVTYVDKLEMTTVTLDTLLAEHGTPHIDAIVMDTQGSELMVLKGAVATLRSARFVMTECADFEAYAGCATCDDLSSFLAQHGFKKIGHFSFARHPGGGQYFNVAYGRT